MDMGEAISELSPRSPSDSLIGKCLPEKNSSGKANYSQVEYQGVGVNWLVKKNFFLKGASLINQFSCGCVQLI